MATASKPDEKRTYSSWFNNLHAQSRASKDAKNASQNNRQLLRATRIETDIKTKFDQLDNNNRLSDRILVVRKWHDDLSSQLNRLKQRIGHLRDAKHVTENFLSKLSDAINVNIQSLTHLDHRRNGEHLLDLIDIQLKEEQSLFNEIQTNLQKDCNEAFHALLELQEATKDFYGDIRDKNEAFHIDIDLYNMNEKSAYVIRKPFSDRKTENSVDLQTWEDMSRNTLEHAQDEIKKAGELIHKLHLNIHQSANRMNAKADKVYNAIQMRIHDTERAFKELEFQRISIEKEKSELLKDIRNLEDSIKAKKSSLKLAETRLDLRKDRPNNENNDDAAQIGLNEEINSLKESIDVLQEQIEKSRNILSDLNLQLGRICQDLQSKRDAWQIYNEIIQIRKQLEKPITTSYPPCSMIPVGIIRENIKF